MLADLLHIGFWLYTAAASSCLLIGLKRACEQQGQCDACDLLWLREHWLTDAGKWPFYDGRGY